MAPNITRKVPVIRALTRWWVELTRSAPLEEFSNYDGYWDLRKRDRKTLKVLDRHKQIASLLPQHAKVLDVGCGDGVFIRYIEDHRPDCDISGVDIAPEAVSQLAAEGFDVQLIDPGVRLKDQVKTGWDAVTLMEVIEHVVDSESMVREVLSLKPSRIFITIPNTGFLLHRLRLMFFGKFPVTNVHYHMKEHVRFWTVSDFRAWAKANCMNLLFYSGQVDRPDFLVNLLGRRFPSLFATRIIYVLEPLTGEGG